jgi:hypothetical protein
MKIPSVFTRIRPATWPTQNDRSLGGEGSSHGGVPEAFSVRHQSNHQLLHGTRLLCAIGVSLCSVVVAGSQTAPATALSGELRAHVQDERFGLVTSIRGLPLGVRYGLQKLFGSEELDIAEPGAEFQANGVVGNSTLPTRRLIAAGCSYDHCLVYYERGGIARTWHVALFHWTPEATRFEWGGTAPRGLVTIDDVRRAILAGAIKGPAELW